MSSPVPVLVDARGTRRRAVRALSVLLALAVSGLVGSTALVLSDHQPEGSGWGTHRTVHVLGQAR